MTRRQVPATRSPRTTLIALLASTALVTNSFAQSLPVGGQVSAGSVAIGAPSAGTLVIDQTSQNAVINWQSFNIGQGNSVTFVQPNAASAILNRVTGTTTTSIAGQLNANGQVYLINPNGIAITATGTVNAGAFVASTLGISDAEFMAGGRTFTGNGASAPVTNAGTITVGRGGYLALIGGSVANSGTITVPLGKAALGSGEQATLDLAGDGFLQVAIPTGAAGGDALVSNSGTISANGGMVQLTAAAARDLARQAVNMSGAIEAKGVSGKNGDIMLFGSEGKVVVTGRIDASNATGTGGSVTVASREIALATAVMDASGDSGGGTINIGGERHGGGTMQRAETLTVDAGTVINADAISTGNGGDVVLWSDNFTGFAGTITARGGSLSGNGGEAEVSGKALLAYTGLTDLSAAHGRFGTLLLDPYNVIISAGTDTSGFTATGDDSIINVATLQNALATANVTVSTGSGGTQAGNITVATAISWTAGTALTLAAANDIIINGPITFGGTAGAGLTLNAGNALAINAPIQVRGAGAVALNYNPASASNLSFGLTGGGFIGGLTYRSSTGAALTSGAGGTLSVNGDAYTLLYSMHDVETLPGQNFGEGYFALAHDLDASGRTYNDALIGNTSSDTFYGTLEGLGHTISNLTIVSSVSGPIGLIGRLDRLGAAGNGTDGAVRNIGLVGGSVTGGIGFAGFEGTGGLVGANNGGTISNAYNTGTVSGDFRVGGLVGVNSEGRIISSYATGAVSAVAGPNAHDYIGGLVGLNYADYNSTIATVTNSYATGTVSGGSYVGGLIGYSGVGGGGYGGFVTDVYATGAVHGTGNYVGGLVGFHYGRLTNAYATGAVSGADYVGGLAGRYNGDTPFSHDVLYATGTVSGRNFVGGLIGHNTSGLLGSYATGAVTGTGDYVGGLIGTNMAYLEAVYATGAVSSTGNNVGGLAGENQLGRLTGAYATGEVRGADIVGGLVGLNSGQVINAYATGAVTGANDVGGLVGLGFWASAGISGTVTNAYATGAVTGSNNVGGLVGYVGMGIMTNVYATGAVSSTGNVGGLVGYNGGFTLTNGFWNTQTTGQSAGGVASAMGLTTAQFQSGSAAALGSAFAGGTGGLYPYLASFYPGGVEAISGYAYSNAGTTPLASGMGGAQYVFASAGGAGQAPVTTGANGYYYILMPNGTLPSGGTQVLAYTTANNAATGTMNGATLVQAAGTTAGVDLYGGYLRLSTTSTLYSTAQSERASTLASLSSAQQGALAALAPFFTATHASGFTLDQALNLSSGFGVQTTAGELTVAASITLAGSNALTLASAGELAINAPISVTGDGQVRLSHSTANTITGGLTFGAGNALTFADGEASQTLHINGHEYMLVRSMAGIAGMDNQWGRYALARDLDAGPNRMGAVASIFNGTLDGLGHTISNLTINDIPVEDISFFHYDYVGLIGQLTGTVRNIGVIGGSITGRNYAGALVGFNAGLVQNAYATARVTGYNLDLGASYTGGLVGLNTGTVSNSYAAGIVSGTSVIGGLVGENNGLIVASHAAGVVSGWHQIGGLVGFQTGTINSSYASGVVSGIEDVGGLVGNNSGNVESSYATGAVTGSGDNIGGLVGSNSIDQGLFLTRVANSYATGSVSGRNYVGGLVGYNLYEIRDSYATGTVSGSDYVGGLAGYGQGNVFNNHASGAVSGFNNVGGLLGYGSGTDAYATGAVTGISNVGGLIGSGSALRSHATGAVTGTTNVGGLLGSGSANESHASGAVTGSDNVGGLVGYHTAGGAVYLSYATGTVIGINNVGGLVGHSDRATSAASYATGAVSGVNRVGGLVGYLSNGPVGYGSTSLSFATGAVSGVSNVGGLVGESYKSNVSFAYATGAVSGASNVGGLIGKTSGELGNSQYGLVTSTYATGVVSGTTNVGGLVGANDLGTITNGYWDTQTSGQSGSAGGTGLTTGQLQGLEPLSGSTYFSVAANLTNYFSGGMDGVYPFLSHFYPGYVQAISGYATTSTGAAAVAAQVALYQDGNQLGGTISTGANGYYYTIVAPHTLAAGGSLGQTITLAGATAASGLSYNGGLAIGANGHLTGLSVASGWRDITDAAPAWSALITAPTTAFGTDRYAALAAALAGSSIRVNATATGGFTLDTALSLGSNDVTIAASGPLTLAQAITANTITLASGGAFTNLVGASALNAGNRWLAYSANPADNMLGGLTPGFIQYNAAYGVTSVAQASGNGLLYTLAPVLTAGLTGSITRTYDGTTAATLASGNYTVSGTVGGDSVTLTGSTGIAYDTANAGTGKTVSASGLGIGSASNGAINVYGYQLASTTASGAIGTITPAVLTYSADATSRLYGNANPSLTGSVTGYVNGETAASATTGTLAFASAAGSTSNVGIYGINGSGLVANNGNYVFTQASANATALSVTARPITVTADALSRIYGDANPALTYTVGGNGLVNGDTLLGALTTTAGQYSNVGTYAITSGISASSNYALTYVGADLSVNQRALTVTADAISRTYGDANQALTYTLGGAGLVNGDTLSGALTTAGQYVNVGSYGIDQGSLGNANYAISYSGAALTIDKRGLDVVANAANRSYGETNPAFAWTATGLVNGDTLSGALTTSADATSNVGSYWITQGTLDNANYALTFTTAQLAITRATLTVTASNAGMTYGDTPPGAIGYTLSGWKNGQTDALLSGVLVGTDAGATSNAGLYSTQASGGSLAGAASGNYALAFVDGVMTINRRALAVSANAATRIYGDADPAFTWGANGLVNGDTLSGSLVSLAGSASGVGVYGITLGTLGNANYDIAYNGADLTVTTRSIAVTASDAIRYYGAADPALAWSVGGMGLVNGDTLSGALATAATRDSQAGHYAITQGTLMASSNYALTFNPGTLTVEMLLTPPAGSLASQQAGFRFGGSNRSPSMAEPGSTAADGSLRLGSDARFDKTVVCLVEGECVTAPTTN